MRISLLVFAASIYAATDEPAPVQPAEAAQPSLEQRQQSLYVAISSTAACWDMVKTFARTQRHQCRLPNIRGPDNPHLVHSKYTEECLPEEYCQARFQCQINGDYHGCSKGTLQSALSEIYQFRCPDGMNILIVGHTPFRRKAKCYRDQPGFMPMIPMQMLPAVQMQLQWEHAVHEESRRQNQIAANEAHLANQPTIVVFSRASELLGGQMECLEFGLEPDPPQ